MLKKVLIGIGTLVLLVIVALLVLVATVDVDRYKPRIEQAAHDKLDRTLKFDGKLSLSVFPTIAVALPHTTLSEHGSDAPFLSLDRARVSLAVLPLLSGRVQAGTASLYGLRATIERHADGTTSLDDLTGGPKPKPSAEATQTQRSSGELPQFEVGGIELVDAQVVYRDERARNTVTLSRLNLKTGAIAARGSTPIELSATVAVTEPPSSVDLSLKSIADVDLAGHAFGIRGLDARARGHSGSDQFDVALTAPKIALDPAHVDGELVKLVATVTGGHQAHADLALRNLAGTRDRFSVAKIAGEVDVDMPTLPQKSVKVNLDGSVDVDVRAQDVAARLGAQFDETRMSSRVEVHGFSPPRIGFDVDVDRLNLDRYVPASAPDGATSGKPAEAATAGKVDPKIDLSALKPLNLAGEARIGALQVHNLKATGIKVGVRAAGGHLEVAPLTARLYQGTLNATAKVDAEGNRVAVSAALEGISIEPLLKDLMGKDILEGHGGVKLNIATAGPSVGAMRRALGGSASLALRDGAVHGINLAQKLRDVKSVLSGGSSQTQAASSAEKTDFSELTATFSIKDGVATNRDLEAKSPLLRVNGAGTIDIGASALDYTVQASVVGTLAGQGGSELSSLRGVTVPVHLSGPFTSLSYQLDWGSLARQAVKAKAADRIKNLIGGKLKQGDQSSGQNLGEALKNLLGK
ncbi:MAG TPA: AsmA family protein [Burkholderiaceae bacterium]|nr:AsmA family protein [Burkholderiaceae bacterium]